MHAETMTVKVPLSPLNKWSLGSFMEKYYEGLKQKKLLGIKCPQCMKVYLPPRKKCGPCFQDMNDWVEIGQRGRIEFFTVGHVDIEDTIKPRSSPTVLAMVKLEGADSLFLGEIRGTSPEKIRQGAIVKVAWVEKPSGSPNDLYLAPGA